MPTSESRRSRAVGSCGMPQVSSRRTAFYSSSLTSTPRTVSYLDAAHRVDHRVALRKIVAAAGLGSRRAACDESSNASTSCSVRRCERLSAARTVGTIAVRGISTRSLLTRSLPAPAAPRVRGARRGRLLLPGLASAVKPPPALTTLLHLRPKGPASRRRRALANDRSEAPARRVRAAAADRPRDENARAPGSSDGEPPPE